MQGVALRYCTLLCTLLFLLNIFLLARPQVAAGNTLETYGLSSRSISMGGAYTAVADDFPAAYYNPAGLTQISQIDMGVRMSFLHANFNSIENVVVGQTHEGEPITGDVDTDTRDNGGLLGGIAVGITDRLAMGVGMYLPSNLYLARLQSQRQREPHYIWYEKRPVHFNLVAGVGVEILKWLSVGVGADILFGPQGGVVLRIPSGQEAKIDLGLNFKPRISPYGGILCKIRKDMSVGVIYREERQHGKLDLSIDAQVDLGLFVVPIVGKMQGMIFYSPRQVSLGWAWKPDPRLLVSLDLAWLQWSKYEDATIDFVVQLGFGGGTTQYFERVKPPGFEDTIVPRAGIEYLVKTWSFFPVADEVELRLRGGYFFLDSPVPEQTGITNYLDSDSHVFSAGVGVAFRHLFGSEKALKLDGHFQFNHLMDRENKKDTDIMDLDGDGTPETYVIGYPGYVTGGDIIVAGFTIGLSF